MSLSKKFFGATAPDWAQPISDEDFLVFKSDVSESLANMKLDHEINWAKSTVSVKPPQSETGPTSLTLHLNNLVITWKDCPKLERKIHVADFLNRLIAGLNRERPDLKECLDQVMIRIYDNEFAVAMCCEVFEEIGEYLKAGLILDLGYSIVTINQGDVIRSGLSAEELFDRARLNLRNYEIEYMDERRGPLGCLHMYGTEIYGASVITILDKFTDSDKTYWVSTPTRNLGIVLEPANLDLESLEKFLAIAGRLSESSPNHFIIPTILEYRDGQLRDLCNVEGRRVIPLDGIFNS